jgi:putative PIN family toxin of toxin-antitoxin system
VRVILDTNVFVSGIFFTGPPYRILEAWRDGKIQLVISQEILEEYQRVGETLGKQFPGVKLQPILELVAMNAEIFSDQPLPGPVCDDPADDKFIACAVVSGCRIIVSGDRHLLKVSGFGGIRVIKPRQFIEEHLFRGE